LTFEVVDEPTKGEVEITDATSGEFTYTPDAGAVGADTFTFRVSEDGVWSEPATISVSIVPASGVRAWWMLDEGSGTGVADSSGLGNDGTSVGSPTWVDRVGQPALRLDGSSQYVVVPHDLS